MNAKEVLLKIKFCEIKLENTLEEIERLREFAENITSRIDPSGIKGKGSYTDKVGNSVSRIVDLEKQQEELLKVMNYRAEVTELIERLPYRYYDILHKIYLQGMSLKEIAYMKDKSYSWATKTHDKAIEALQKLLDQGVKFSA